MVDFAKVRRNVEVRKIAKESMQFITDDWNEQGLTPEDKLHAWKTIFNEVFGHSNANRQLGITPMTYEHARKWYHSTIIDFGKYKGTKLDEIPFQYLEWLSDQPDFRRDLFRFIQSEFVKSQHYLRTDSAHDYNEKQE